MAIGPLHILVIGFDHPDFTGRALDELSKLEDGDVVRLVDLLFVEKDDDGNIVTLQVDEIDDAKRESLGDLAGAFVGLGADLDGDGVADDIDEELWDIAAEIPRGTAAAIVILEHRWAIGLRDALADAGGQLVGDALVPAEELAAMGAEFEAAVRGRVEA